jgi:glutamyl/glutaminyl-tRNA synthetase
MMLSEIVRFAPAPGVSLHLGNIRTALYNWFIAKQTKGKFILRIDDTNQKCTSEFLGMLQDDLNWLGVVPDEGPYLQSTRTERYREALTELLIRDKAYHCYCKENKEGCNCHLLSQKNIEKGYPIKFKHNTESFPFFDRVKGYVTIKDKYDPILWRSDGTPTYHLCSPVDDLDYGVTLIIRGEDLIDSSSYQSNLIYALGGKAISFAHLPLVIRPGGGKISKRDKAGEYTLKELRQEGYLPDAVINVLSLTGWNPGMLEVLSVNEIIKNFLLEDVSKAPGQFDREKLDSFHIRHMRILSHSSFKLITDKIRSCLMEVWGEYLDKDIEKAILNISTEEGWRLNEFSKNLEFLGYDICNESFSSEELEIISMVYHYYKNERISNIYTLSLGGKELVENVVKELPEDGSLKKTKYKRVYHLLRRVLTGKEEGLKFNNIIQLLGEDEVLSRLREVLVRYDCNKCKFIYLTKKRL